MKEWKYKRKIENMKGEEIDERIRKGYDYIMPKLTLIPYVGGEERVTYTTKDFVARCPVTGISDVYELDIIFTPNKYIPELKSLKLYFNEFQTLPISHEHLGAKIFKEFKNQVKPKKLEIVLIAAIRGGIITKVELKGGER